MALFKLNGMTHYVPVRDVQIKEVSSGRFEIAFDEGAHIFTVVGGRASGGAAHEWFCHRPEMFGDVWLPTKSMAAAIKLGCCY